MVEIEGLDELEKMLQEMTITPEAEAKALRMALQPVKSAVERNTPVGATGKLKGSVKIQVKRDGFGIAGVVKLGRFYDRFQEFGTSKSKKHVGFFDKAVNQSQDEAVKILADQLLK